MTNNSTFNPTGKTPSQILNHYFGNNMPQVLKDNPFLVDLMGWTVGSNPLIGSIPGNSFSIQSYTQGKSEAAAKKAWQSGNIWDYFSYDFYTIPGYNNLDKMWGGGTIKGILETLLGFDEKGNISIGNTLLDLTYLIPVGGEASLLARLGLTGISKVGLNAVERVLGKETVKLLSRGLSSRWETFKDLINPILKKIPVRLPSLNKIWDNVVTAAKLINLDPVQLYKTLKNTSVGKLVLGNNQQKLQNLLRKLDLRGKIKPSELPYIGKFIKSAIEGPGALVKFGLELFTKASPTAIKNLVNSSNFKKQYLSKILDISKSQTYTNVQKVLTPYLKSFLEKNLVYNTAKKVDAEYQQIKNQGVVGYTVNKINSLKKAITDNKYVKKAGEIISKAKHEYKQIKKQGIVNYAKTKLKKYVKPAYNKYVKPIVQTVKKAYNKYVKPIVQTVKNAWNGFKSWIGFRGPADHSYSSFISRASGFTYQGYTGSRKSISQTIGSMSGNCVDGTLAQVALASSFGIPAEMVRTTWNGNPHVYGRINGVDRDIANHALTGSWSRPPAGPDESDSVKEIHLHIEGDVYGPDFENKVKGIAEKYLDTEIGFANQY